MKKHTHPTLRLHGDPTRSLFAEVGQQLVALHGTVIVTTAPLWLAGTVWRSQVIIQAGQVHTVDAAGWLNLSTDAAGAELLCLPAQAAHPPITPLHFVHTLRALARRAFA